MHGSHDHAGHHRHAREGAMSGVSGYALAPAAPAPALGHNARERVAQWQEPHGHGTSSGPEPDFDLLEASFAENFPRASDPTSFLRLARIPFVGRHADGRTLRLLRVEYEQVTDVGAVAPSLGGKSHRYDPLPAALVSTRRRLSLAYDDGEGLVHLSLAEARALKEEGASEPGGI